MFGRIFEWIISNTIYCTTKKFKIRAIRAFQENRIFLFFTQPFQLSNWDKRSYGPSWKALMARFLKFHKIHKVLQKMAKIGQVFQNLAIIAKSYQKLEKVSKCCQKFVNVAKKICNCLASVDKCSQTQTSYLSNILHQHILKILKIYPKKRRKSRYFEP